MSYDVYWVKNRAEKIADFEHPTFWGNYCKRAINGIYNWVSRKHMQRYFDEFCFRYNTRNVSINERFAEAILHCKSRLTYNKLTA